MNFCFLLKLILLWGDWRYLIIIWHIFKVGHFTSNYLSINLIFGNKIQLFLSVSELKMTHSITVTPIAVLHLWGYLGVSIGGWFWERHWWVPLVLNNNYFSLQEVFLSITSLSTQLLFCIHLQQSGLIPWRCRCIIDQ